MPAMLPEGRTAADLAQVRFDNALRLFDEFVQATVRHPDAATLRGLERRFAEQLLIQPSYWSQIKARSRQIGERLARQFEQRCRKPAGWMDQPRDEPLRIRPTEEPLPEPSATPSVPQDDDERFIVGLVLSYYRRHPQRARTRLLDLLGEVLTPPPAPPAAAPGPGATGEAQALWLQSQRGVAPLKKKR
ncbi:MAG: hypothetical protein ACKVQR_16640 [Aquabacterium sp.]